jgi:hypothetical protein
LRRFFESGRCAREPLSVVLGQSLPIRPLAANVAMGRELPVAEHLSSVATNVSDGGNRPIAAT